MFLKQSYVFLYLCFFIAYIMCTCLAYLFSDQPLLAVAHLPFVNSPNHSPSTYHLNYYDCLEDKREILSELFCAVLCTAVMPNATHTQM